MEYMTVCPKSIQSARNRFIECQGFVLRKTNPLHGLAKTEVGTECLTDLNEVNMPGRFLAMR